MLSPPSGRQSGKKKTVLGLLQISRTVRSWRLHRQTSHSLAGLARAINPVVRGWLQDYGRSTAPRCIPSCSASTPT